MALTDISDAEKNAVVDRLIGESRHNIRFRVGAYKVAIRGGKDRSMYWSIEVGHPDMRDSRIVTITTTTEVSTLYKCRSLPEAVSLALAVIVDLENIKEVTQ